MVGEQPFTRRIKNWNCYIQSSGKLTARLWHNKSRYIYPVCLSYWLHCKFLRAEIQIEYCNVY